jgi:hypothetical protein
MCCEVTAGAGRTDAVEVRLEVHGGGLPVRLEALDDHLLDVHGDGGWVLKESRVPKKLCFLFGRITACGGRGELSRSRNAPVAQRLRGGGQTREHNPHTSCVVFLGQRARFGAVRFYVAERKKKKFEFAFFAFLLFFLFAV